MATLPDVVGRVVVVDAGRIPVGPDEVHTVHVVDVPVAVVVDAVAGDLVRVGPHAVLQVRVVWAETGVQHGHGHSRVTDGLGPSRDCADVVARR